MKRVLAILAFAAVLLPAAAQAQVFGLQDRDRDRDGLRPRLQQDLARDEVREGRRKSLDEVIREISRRQPGEFVGMRESYQGGRLVYIVRWKLPDGRIVDIPVDPERR